MSLSFEEVQSNIDEVIASLQSDLSKINIGQANPEIITSIKVSCYGSFIPILHIARVNVVDSRTICVEPFDKKMLQPISEAIAKSEFGFNPINNGENIRIIFPALTEERRKELVKIVGQKIENAKVKIRNIRKEKREQIDKATKEGLSENVKKQQEDNLEKKIKTAVEKIDEIYAQKEKKLMTV